MPHPGLTKWLRGLRLGALLLILVPDPAVRSAPAATNAATVLAVENRVEIRRAGSQDWDKAYVGQSLRPGDRGRTGARSRSTLRLSDLSVVRVGPDTEFEIEPLPVARQRAILSLWRGLLYFFNREKPVEGNVRTPAASAAIRGTEFVLRHDERTGTTLTLLEGEVLLGDLSGQTLTLRTNEEGTVRPGRPPEKTAVIDAAAAVQWCLYYPAVLDVTEVGLTSQAQDELAEVLAAYRCGDLLRALSRYPSAREPAADPERVFLAALLLAAGEVEPAERLLMRVASGSGKDDRPTRLTGALRTMISVVKRPPNTAGPPVAPPPTLATEWLVESYRLQSATRLAEAAAAARKATALSPEFGFAWARLAELEFSFAHISAAENALETSLRLAPCNAQALALRGFLLAARNRTTAASAAFEQAISADGALGNAWLGRGLCRIRQGDRAAGRADLQTAATLEPQRSLLRSYLGKAFGHEGDEKRAFHELELARQLDPADPTPWLYSALLLHDHYQTADAIHELETSQQLNNNRAVYRSRLLLDQDQAVRSANLANLFEDAGMSEVSVHESARAVSFDYANYSAHLNLASSFNQLRDPTRFNLRYESEWFNEHLLASLLAPVGAGSLSQNLSQQEYSQLFAGKRFGLSGTTEYFSDGEWRQSASQFGTFGNTSYALDLDYQHKNGTRIDNDLERIEWYSRIKQQLGSQDSLLALIKYQDYDAGDNFQYYDPAVSARPGFRFEETQTPLLLGGWHHEWSPGVHTLFLGGRLVNDQDVVDTGRGELAAIVNPPGMFDPDYAVPFDVKYHSEFETYTVELNQIFQREKHTDILGARYQDGNFKADAALDNPPANTASLFALPVESATDADFRRVSLYAYHHWEIVDNLLLIGGVAYDVLDYPANFRRPPLQSVESHKERWSPKAALVWDLLPQVRVRGVFSRAVGGVSYDESVRLEPTQLAGFAQSFRSVISESLVGSVEAPDYQIAGGAVDLRLGTNTWLSLQGEVLRGEVTRDFGIFVFDFFPAPGAPAGTPANTTERYDYHEWLARAVLNQILGREFFLEAQYQFTRSELERELLTIPATPNYDRSTLSQADLHEVKLAAMWRSPTGFFARGEFRWFAQCLGGGGSPPPGDSFPQVNLYAGYRFPKRHAELTLGLLNLTDEDYRLSPLNYYLEMPRERLFYARFRFNF